MSHKFGFPAMTNRALGNKSPNQPSASENSRFLIRVTEINLDPSKGFDQIGVLSGNKISPTGIDTGKILTNVYPSNTSIKKLPVINEYVWVWKTLAPNSFSGQYVWEGPISLYGGAAPNANIQPSPYNDVKPPSQKINYTQAEVGAVNVVDNNLPTISTSNSPQNTFSEKDNIHPLLPFSGDVIYEGRWGNSIRLGNTSKVTGQYANNWSTSGNNGDPITILRNGQDPNSSDFGAEPIVENINKDLSSIYLTSTQKIPFSLAREEKLKWKTYPTTPSQYNSSQIIFNSDRIVINAKNDSILIGAQQSIGLTCYEEINLTGKNTILDSTNIYLGSKNATESVLLGDKTITTLKQITSLLKSITSVLQLDQMYPGGIPVPNGPLNTVSLTSKQIFAQIESSLDNLASKKVKVE